MGYLCIIIKPSPQGASGTKVDDLVNQLLEKIKKTSYSSNHSKNARWTPSNLKERLAMEEVLSNPEAGKHLDKIIMNDKTNGWIKEDGWIKMSKNVEGIEIHYVYNTKLNVFDDFKFK